MKAATWVSLAAAAFFTASACQKEPAPAQTEQLDSEQALTEEEEEALQAVYENEAAEDIAPANAEQVAEELEKEIAGDLAELE